MYSSGGVELIPAQNGFQSDLGFGWIDRLPEVTPSLGLPAVEARIISIRPMSTSISSAAICASAVRMP